MSKQGRMGAFKLVPAVAVAIVGVAGCDTSEASSPTEYDYVTVCVDNKGNSDPADDIRLDDDDPRCPDRVDDNGDSQWDESNPPSGGSFVFISTSSGYQVPPVGQPVRYAPGVTSSKPSGLPAGTKFGTKVIPKAGTTGAVTRGGFGVSSSGGSSGG